jgi:hypothetical protein
VRECGVRGQVSWRGGEVHACVRTWQREEDVRGKVSTANARGRDAA